MTVEILYPEICNLYGDLMNIRYLQRSCREVSVIETSIFDTPQFANRDDIDLIYLGTMTEKAQIRVVEALKPLKKRIRKLIESGQAFLVTGNALEVFGSYIEEKGRSEAIQCLDIFPLYAKRDLMHERYNSFYVGNFKDSFQVVGFKTLFGFSYGSVPPLFETVRGTGLNRETMSEGIHVNHFMATYVTGPLLPMNPKFTDYLLGICGCFEKPRYEKAAMDAYQERLDKFMQPDRRTEF